MAMRGLLSAVLVGGAVLFTAAPAAAQNVEVTLTDGMRLTGRLVSLSDTEVVVGQGDIGQRRFPLTQVSRIQTTSRTVKAWTGAGVGVGFLIALSGDWCGTGEPYYSGIEPACFTPVPLLIVIGSGFLGALIGKEFDISRSRVLYPSSTVSVRVTPLVGKNRIGGGITVIW